jgi:hypothetical protein
MTSSDILMLCGVNRRVHEAGRKHLLPETLRVSVESATELTRWLMTFAQQPAKNRRVELTLASAGH